MPSPATEATSDQAALEAFTGFYEPITPRMELARFVERLLGIKLLHAPLISLASGFRYTDTTNGFRAYSRRLLVDPRIAPFREVFSQYELHYYLAIRAAQLGFRVTETPVCREYPAHGGVPTKIHGWRGNALVLRTLWAACRGKFNPPPATMEQCALRKAA